jgi:hypothetical protein
MANTMRNATKERFWRGTLKRQSASGLSVRAFCRREALAESAFYAWRRTVAERDAEAKQSAAAKRPPFLPVLVRGGDRPSGHSEVAGFQILLRHALIRFANSEKLTVHPICDIPARFDEIRLVDALKGASGHCEKGVLIKMLAFVMLGRNQRWGAFNRQRETCRRLSGKCLRRVGSALYVIAGRPTSRGAGDARC